MLKVNIVTRNTFPAVDPRTGDVIAQIAEDDKEDVDIVVVAARKAFSEGPWPKMIAYFADLLEKHNDQIAALESWDTGNHLNRLIWVTMLTSFFRYYAGLADKIHGLTVPTNGSYHVQTQHKPIGACGQIIPWNFPLLMYAWKVAPALACVNTVVMKTAEQTPLSVLYVSKLFHELSLFWLLKPVRFRLFPYQIGSSGEPIYLYMYSHGAIPQQERIHHIIQTMRKLFVQ